MILDFFRDERRGENFSFGSMVFLTLFVVFYPLFASMYNVLPIFLGISSYLMVLAIKKENIQLLFLTVVYSLSLEINFSLPMFNIIIATLLFYLICFNKIKQFMTCKPCIVALSIILIYFIFFVVLIVDDMIFATSNHTMDINWFFLFNVALDILLAVML